MTTFQPWLVDTMQLVKNIADILSAIASVGIFFVALAGLRQWSAELRGRVELDTAKSILRDILKVKYAIGKCRIPVFFAWESSDREPSPHGESPMEATALDDEHAYRKRMSQLTTAALNFEASAIEAEVLWGNEAVEARNNVINLYNRLSKAHTAYFPNVLRDARSGKDTHEDWVEAARRVLFVPANNDEFGSEAKEIFEKAEHTFRKYLLSKQQLSKSSKAKGARA
jgi:hypothetical protein